jgi:cytochrome P450
MTVFVAVARMTVKRARLHERPPEPDQQFDIGSTEDSLERMRELFARYGDIYRVYAPGRKSYTYVIHHPDDVKRVLVSNHKNYTKGVGLDRVKILLGNGIMTSEGDFWRKPALHDAADVPPARHHGICTRHRLANDRLHRALGVAGRARRIVNVTDDMSALTLDIVLRAVFGRDLDRSEQESGRQSLCSRDPGAGAQPAVCLQIPLARQGRGAAHAPARRAQPRGARRLPRHAHERARQGDGDPMSERELIDEVMTLVVAGHETTASALNWTWYLLALHPQVEARLHAEIDAAPVEAARVLRRWRRCRTRSRW